MPMKPVASNAVRIIVTRPNYWGSSAGPILMDDSGKEVGNVKIGDQLAWDREPGSIELTAISNSGMSVPLKIGVNAGQSYQVTLRWDAYPGRQPALQVTAGETAPYDPAAVNSNVVTRAATGQPVSSAGVMAGGENSVSIGMAVKCRLVRGWGMSHMDLGITVKAEDGQTHEYIARDNSILITAGGEQIAVKQAKYKEYINKRLEITHAIITDARRGFENSENGKPGILTMRVIE